MGGIVSCSHTYNATVNGAERTLETHFPKTERVLDPNKYQKQCIGVDTKVSTPEKQKAADNFLSNGNCMH